VPAGRAPPAALRQRDRALALTLSIGGAPQVASRLCSITSHQRGAAATPTRLATRGDAVLGVCHSRQPAAPWPRALACPSPCPALPGPARARRPAPTPQATTWAASGLALPCAPAHRVLRVRNKRPALTLRRRRPGLRDGGRRAPGARARRHPLVLAGLQVRGPAASGSCVLPGVPGARLAARPVEQFVRSALGSTPACCGRSCCGGRLRELCLLQR